MLLFGNAYGIDVVGVDSRRYIFPAQELQHAVDKLTGKRYREARSVTLKKRKTESAPYSVQLSALEFLKKYCTVATRALSLVHSYELI